MTTGLSKKQKKRDNILKLMGQDAEQQIASLFLSAIFPSKIIYGPPQLAKKTKQNTHRNTSR